MQATTSDFYLYTNAGLAMQINSSHAMTIGGGMSVGGSLAVTGGITVSGDSVFNGEITKKVTASSWNAIGSATAIHEFGAGHTMGAQNWIKIKVDLSGLGGAADTPCWLPIWREIV